jgi:PKD domain
MLSALVAVLATTLFLPHSPAHAGTTEPPIDSGWDDSGIGSGGWNPVAGGYWGALPIGFNLGPYEYKYEFLCLIEDNNFDKACLTGTIQCTAAEGGRPILWYWSPRGFVPPEWRPLDQPSCIYSEDPSNVLDDIAAQIQEAFEHSPVLPATVASQPGPNTLRGANTNFYADATTQIFDIELLGQQVHIVATPVQYSWNYGDGTTLGPTPAAGAPLPQARWGEKTATSHSYPTTGDYVVSLTTHFRGTYAVNGGPALPIPGEGSFTSPPLRVSVWRAETKNYADNCLQNPLGNGCPGVPPSR